MRPAYEASLRFIDVGSSVTFRRAKPQCVRNAALRALGKGNYTSRTKGATVTVTRIK